MLEKARWRLFFFFYYTCKRNKYQASCVNVLVFTPGVRVLLSYITPPLFPLEWKLEIFYSSLDKIGHQAILTAANLDYVLSVFILNSTTYWNVLLRNRELGGTCDWLRSSEASCCGNCVSCRNLLTVPNVKNWHVIGLSANKFRKYGKSSKSEQ